MVETLIPYPIYKDSGVPWLGDVPNHWEVKRTKSQVKNVLELSTNLIIGGLYVALENVVSWTGQLRNIGQKTIYDSQMKRFVSGDVLFGKLRPYLAKVTRPNKDGLCVGEFLVLRPTNLKLEPPFLELLLKSKPFIDEVNSSTFGAKMPRADWNFVGTLCAPLPPLDEQLVNARTPNEKERLNRQIALTDRQIDALVYELCDLTPDKINIIESA